MPSIQVTVGAADGLHARPASLFVQAAARQPVRVTVARPGAAPVDARSFLAVLTLAAGHGETLELTAEGDAAPAALDELAALLASDPDTTPVP
ncbi:HPr family phosphocarrier protein [Streptomyces sp. NPDC001455]|uniref:HPr family phosphocarrier protein n=1 Tax=Streptomyces sp. NPDC001455 TaxID=3154518 RepID=UPI003321A1B7